MKPAVYDTIAVNIKANEYDFKANGQTIKFKGFMTLYVEGTDGKEKEEENGLKVTDLNAVTPDMRPNAWEENLQEAMNDTSWYEVVAIQSGIPRLMMEEKEWFFNYLREQIILRGNESSMNSLHEIKNYFANLTRQGSHVSSTTQVALKKFLKNRQEQQQCSPYETITNGIRTYDGHPIPAYAKPRPSAAHIWNPVTNEWTR